MNKRVVVVAITFSFVLMVIGLFVFIYSSKSYTSNKVNNNLQEESIKHDDNNINSNNKIIDNNQNNNTVGSMSEETFVTSKGFTGYVKDGVTYIDGIMIVNKTYSLPDSYGSGLTKETENAFYKMQSAARADNINIFVRSGYRSYIDQRIIYNGYVENDGKDAADRYSARPGHSEHQSGYAIDLNSLDNDFANTPEGIWLNENAYKYGFILRYTEEGETSTGYMYEPWHYRYVGENLATILYNHGKWITLEDYLGITSEYS